MDLSYDQKLIALLEDNVAEVQRTDCLRRQNTKNLLDAVRTNGASKYGTFRDKQVLAMKLKMVESFHKHMDAVHESRMAHQERVIQLISGDYTHRITKALTRGSEAAGQFKFIDSRTKARQVKQDKEEAAARRKAEREAQKRQKDEKKILKELSRSSEPEPVTAAAAAAAVTAAADAESQSVPPISRVVRLTATGTSRHPYSYNPTYMESEIPHEMTTALAESSARTRLMLWGIVAARASAGASGGPVWSMNTVNCMYCPGVNLQEKSDDRNRFVCPVCRTEYNVPLNSSHSGESSHNGGSGSSAVFGSAPSSMDRFSGNSGHKNAHKRFKMKLERIQGMVPKWVPHFVYKRICYYIYEMRIPYEHLVRHGVQLINSIFTQITIDTGYKCTSLHESAPFIWSQVMGLLPPQMTNVQMAEQQFIYKKTLPLWLHFDNEMKTRKRVQDVAAGKPLGKVKRSNAVHGGYSIIANMNLRGITTLMPFTCGIYDPQNVRKKDAILHKAWETLSVECVPTPVSVNYPRLCDFYTDPDDGTVKLRPMQPQHAGTATGSTAASAKAGKSHGAATASRRAAAPSKLRDDGGGIEDMISRVAGTATKRKAPPGAALATAASATPKRKKA